ncbi:MAG TPA: NAD-dependent deacylase [Burkholderiaceae bacterium]|nr:NAD-dependent deacylase [Burkholderiaceae bacterium]
MVRRDGSALARPPLIAQSLSDARRYVASARRIAVLTGAGISAESGIPTFRDATSGLWAKFDPMRLASEDGFRADPSLVWRWYAWRRGLVSNAQPNAGHYVLASARSRFDSFELITQNVDGLHARAGSVPIELHGNIMRTVCLARCGLVENDPQRLPPGEPPRCPRCGDWLRPGVVWFGEMLDAATLQQAEQAASQCDLMLVVGTSGLVYPAAGLPAAALRGGAKVIIVNPQASELDDLATVVVRGTAATVLPRLLAASVSG